MGAARSEQITVYPDPTLSLNREEVQRRVDYLQAQISTDVDDCCQDVENTINNEGNSSPRTHRGEFASLVDNTFSRALDNGTMLAMIMDKVERAVDSHRYLRYLATTQ